MIPCWRVPEAGEFADRHSTGPKFWLEVIVVDLALWVGLIYALRLTF